MSISNGASWLTGSGAHALAVIESEAGACRRFLMLHEYNVSCAWYRRRRDSRMILIIWMTFQAPPNRIYWISWNA